MGTRSAILSVKLLVDNAQAKKGFSEAETGLGKFQGKVDKLTAPAAGVIGGIIALGKTTTDAASNAEQAMGGLDSVFGDSADTMKDFAKSAAKTNGLSQAQYGELATKVGASLKNMGLPVDQAAKKTAELISQGADLAATFGGTTEDAVNALGAALRGEADPAERYGLALKQTAVEAKLAEKGQSKLTGAAKNQARANAILEMTTEQAGGAIGAFARESDTAAGSTQIATAEAENAKVALGTALLPVVVALSSAMSALAGFMQENATAVQIVIGVIGALAAGILIVNGALKAYKAIQTVVTAVTWLWNAALSANPIALIIIAVIAFVAAIVILWKKCEGFRKVVIAVWNAIKSAAIVAFNAIKQVIGAVVGWIQRTIQTAGRIIGGVWNTIKTVAATAWNAIKTPIAAVITWISGKVRGIITTVTTAWNKLKGIATTAWNAVKQPVSDLIKWIKEQWDKFITAIGVIWDKLKGIAKTAWDAVKTPVEAVIKWITDKWDDLVGAVGRIWDKIAAAVQTAIAPIKAAIDGIKAAWDTTVGAISGAIEKVQGWLNGILDKISQIGKKEIAGTATKPGTASVSTAGFATRGLSAGAVAGPQSTATGASGGTTINVYGALDADNVARQIQTILSGRVRRVGPVRLGGATL